MTAIVMLVSGALFTLIAAMLRFESSARVLTHYSDGSVAPKNRWASKYFLGIALMSFAGGVASLTFPQFATAIFAVWLTTVVVVAFVVTSK